MTEPVPVKTGGARLGLIVGGIVVLAVVAAVIVDAVRPPVLLDPNSPEGVVQSFLIAIDEERYSDAYGFLSGPAQAQCEESDLTVDQQSMSRVVVEDVNVFDTETIVILNANGARGRSVRSLPI